MGMSCPIHTIYFNIIGVHHVPIRNIYRNHSLYYMSKDNSASFKRLIRKYEFLLEDWEDVSEISKTANLEMMREINARKPKNILEDDFTVEEEEDRDKEREEETPQDIVLKKLFRKIVFKSHPDRLDSDISELERIRLVSLYEQAVSAHDDKNWALMVVTAIKLDVELPEEAEDMVEQIENEAAELENKIQQTTSGIAWQFYHAEEGMRVTIVENYLSILNKSLVKKVEEKKEKASKLILGVGHPRTGTGYTAKLLQSWGLDVGHEVMGEHGTVDWSLAPGEKSLWQDVDFKDFDWEHIIYCVRDPRDSIASIAYTENIEGPSLKFRTDAGVLLTKNKTVDAILSIILWDELIEKIGPTFTYRIEDQPKDLFNYLKESGYEVKWNESVLNQKINSREHLNIESLLEESGYIGNLYKNKINKYCYKYGYDALF